MAELVWQPCTTPFNKLWIAPRTSPLSLRAKKVLALIAHLAEDLAGEPAKKKRLRLSIVSHKEDPTPQPSEQTDPDPLLAAENALLMNTPDTDGENSVSSSSEDGSGDQRHR